MKKSCKRLAQLLLLSASVAVASFAPHQQIDHESKPTNGCGSAAITLGPGSWSSQPIYVAIEDDSTDGIVHYRSDVMFQKSDDGGRTWLPADVLVRRGAPFATYPDITTDRDGSVYVIYNDDSTARHRLSCQRSRDGGATWSEPTSVVEGTALIGMGSIAVDSGGNLFCAWNQGRLDDMHIYASVSSDRGATWASPVRVDDDTTNWGCNDADVFVQPVTNYYLVVGTAPIYSDPVIVTHAFFYRSTDMGHTFQPGVQLDTFGGVTSQPHVVADAQHVICDYSGDPRHSEQIKTEARTFYTEPDTWGSPSLVSRLDTSQFKSYYNGGQLAISADGRVHTSLMIGADTSESVFLTYYASSSDHGATWSDLELVNDDTTADSWNPDIAADSAGHAYLVWQVGSGHVWFSTNNPPPGIAEGPTEPAIIAQPSATVIRGVLLLPAATSHKLRATGLLDISGREVLALRQGANDVSHLSPGVYFVREEPQASSHKLQSVRKVVVAR